MNWLKLLTKRYLQTTGQGALVLSLMVLTACSKEVQKVEHKPQDNSQLIQEVAEQELAGEFQSFQISFDAATDYKLRGMAANETKFEEQVVAMRIKLDALLQDDANVAVKGNMKTLAATAQDKVAYKALYDKVVFPYASFVLNKDFIENEHYTGDDRFRRMLDTFNRALIVLIESNPDYVAETKILDLYWYAMSRTCRAPKKDPIEMRGDLCRVVLRYFDTDRNTSKILQYYANTLLPRLKKAYDGLVALEKAEAASPSLNVENEISPLKRAEKIFSDLVVAYYRVVQISLKTRNASISSRNSSDLSDVFYLKGTFYLEKFFAMQPPSASLREARDFYNNDFSSILSRAKEKIDDPIYREEFKQIIATNDFWRNYSERRLDDAEWLESMFALASAPEMRDTQCAVDGSDDTQSCLAIAAKQSLTEADVTGQEGLFKMVSELISHSDGLALVKNLNIDTEFSVSEELYLVDQIFRGHWNVNKAGDFWAGKNPTRADKQALFLETEKYLKFRLAKMIRRTNEFMGRVFSDKDEKSTSADKFRTAVRESQRLTAEWKALKDQLKDLEKFVHQIGRSTDASLELEEFQRLERMFDNLEKNINLLAVYPNMLALAFFAAVENFGMVIRFWWFEFTLDPTVIINWLFAQISSNPPRPWFDWGTDPRDAKILKFENLYSLYYALKTNTFETIDQALKEAGTDKEITSTAFFKVMIDKFLNDNRLYIKDFIDKQEKAYKNNANYENSLLMCQEEKKAQEDPNHVPNYVTQKLTLDYVGIKTLLPLHTWGESNAKPVFGFYSSEAADQLKYINGSLQHRLTFLNVMIDLLEKHWRSLEERASGEERVALKEQHDRDLVDIRNEFGEINVLMRRVYLHMLGTYRESRDCLEVLYGLERHQQWQVLARLSKFFRNVHSLMTKVQEVNAEKPVVVNVEELTADEEAAMKQWEDRLQAAIAEVNSSLREDPNLRLYSDAKGDVDGAGNPINYYDNISVDGDNVVFEGAKWDALVRISNWIEREINTQIQVERPPREILTTEYDLYQDAHERKYKTSIQYNDDVEEFINLGLREYENKFFEYTDKDWKIHEFENRLSISFQLLKAREFGIYNDAFKDYKYDCSTPPGSEDEVCKTGVPYDEVDRREMIMNIVKIAEYIHINPSDPVYDTGAAELETEESIMRRLGLNRKFELVSGFSIFGGKKSLFLETSSRKPLPLFDTYFKDVVIKGTGFLGEAKTLVITLESLGRESEDGALAESEAGSDTDSTLAGKHKLDELIFLSEEDEIRRISYGRYGAKVQSEFAVMRGVADDMKALQGEDHTNGVDRSYLYEIDPNNSNLEASRTWMSPKVTRDGEPEYIGSVRLDDLDTVIKNFHRETRQRFAQ